MTDLMDAAIVALTISAFFAVAAGVEYAARWLHPDPDFTRPFDDRPIKYAVTEAGWGVGGSE